MCYTRSWSAQTIQCVIARQQVHTAAHGTAGLVIITLELSSVFPMERIGKPKRCMPICYIVPIACNVMGMPINLT